MSQPVRFSNYLPYAGSVIIFLGVTRLIIFYMAFGISIVDFLDFSEILTSFLDIISLSVLFVAISVLHTILMASKDEISSTQNNFKSVIEEKNLFKRLWLYIKLLREFLLGGLLLIIIFYVWHFFSKDITNKSIAWIAIFFIVSFLVAILRIEVTRKHEEFNSSPVKRQFSGMMFLLLLFVGIVFSISRTQITSIKEDKSTLGTAVTLESDEIIISDSTNYYIGKTQNYLFIHHEKDNSTEVIPMSRVKRILIKKKRANGLKLFSVN